MMKLTIREALVRITVRVGIGPADLAVYSIGVLARKHPTQALTTYFAPAPPIVMQTALMNMVLGMLHVEEHNGRGDLEVEIPDAWLADSMEGA